MTFRIKAPTFITYPLQPLFALSQLIQSGLGTPLMLDIISQKAFQGLAHNEEIKPAMNAAMLYRSSIEST
jgi:hypothetical protein